MKKHKLKKLRKRMYLKFRAVRVRREKKKELAFRYKLMEKVSDIFNLMLYVMTIPCLQISEARKFDVEKYVAEYLKDYHTPLLPLTYKGKRLPEWLIKVRYLWQKWIKLLNCYLLFRSFQSKIFRMNKIRKWRENRSLPRNNSSNLERLQNSSRKESGENRTLSCSHLFLN